MPRESAYDKATRYLAEGRVIVREITRYGIVAAVRGEGAIYRTSHQFGVWECTCPAKQPTCSHIAAVKRVTATDLEEMHR